MLIERHRDVLKKYSSFIIVRDFIRRDFDLEVRDFIRRDFDLEVSCCDKYITT